MSPNYSGKNILCLSYFAIFCTVRGHQHRARRRRAAFSLGQPGNDHPGSFCDGLPSKSRLIILPASLTSLEVRKWSLFTFSISAYVCYVQTLATPLCPPTTRLPITRKCAVTAVCRETRPGHLLARPPSFRPPVGRSAAQQRRNLGREREELGMSVGNHGGLLCEPDQQTGV